MESIKTEAAALHEELLSHRRWLHSHAETGFELHQTKEYVRQVLADMGITATDCGKAGLTALLGDPNTGKTILLRADMDALPMEEETADAFACPTGAMHACGHDLHTTMLLGAAKLLKARESELGGAVKLMFQPAEEILAGAKDMIEQGVLEDPKPGAAIMIHVTAAAPIPAGTVIVCAPGISAPAADYFTVRVQGKSCHGSTPHLGVDALTAGAHILLALQEIHARELAPGQDAVLTVGTFHGGSADNVIADTAILGGTIRAYTEETRQYIKERITAISQSVAEAYRASAQVEFSSGCPTLVNDKELAGQVYGCLSAAFGKTMILNAADHQGASRGGGSEDFAYISHRIPSVMLAMAAGEPQKGFSHPLHHPKVRFDESILSTGAAVFAVCALDYLK